MNIQPFLHIKSLLLCCFLSIFFLPICFLGYFFFISFFMWGSWQPCSVYALPMAISWPVCTTEYSICSTYQEKSPLRIIVCHSFKGNLLQGICCLSIQHMLPAAAHFITLCRSQIDFGAEDTCCQARQTRQTVSFSQPQYLPNVK